MGIDLDQNDLPPSVVPQGARDERFIELFDLSLKIDPEYLRQRLKATAILTKWDESLDDLNLEDEVDQLGQVLQEKYRYDVKLLRLKEENPQEQIMNTLRESIRTALMDSYETVIIYYGGHGRQGSLGQLYLVPRLRDPDGQPPIRVDWEPVEKLLRAADLNVLIILDCCYPGSRADRRFPRNNEQDRTSSLKTKRKFQVLCACEASKQTLANSVDHLVTFTSALTKAFELLASCPIFTSTQLLQTLFHVPKFPSNQFPELWNGGSQLEPDITLGPSLVQKDVKTEDQDQETYFDLRFHVTNQPNIVQLQGLASMLKEISEQGIFSPKSIEWKGFNTTQKDHEDLNVVESVDYQVFDSGLASATCSSEASDQSDDFIAQIEVAVDDLVNKQPRGQNSQQKPSKPSAIKIAIIDTGYDAEHPLFRLAPDYVKDHKAFIFCAPNEFNAEALKKSNCDTSGHGTHGTWMLRTIAPNAEIYVAKITDGTRYRKFMASGLSEAIRYAWDTWRVDIISIAVGFPYITEVLKDAVDYVKDKVLIFAAASNYGANRRVPISVPARLPGVFCIHSTDAYGKPSNFTPTRMDTVDNFATLGENVRSAWPKQKRKGLEYRLSGTSAATPIAAGFAAVLLEFGQRYLDENEQELLRSPQGMRQVLKEVAHDSGGYYYLNPTAFARGRVGDDGNETSPLEIIKDALRRLRDVESL